VDHDASTCSWLIHNLADVVTRWVRASAAELLHLRQQLPATGLFWLTGLIMPAERVLTCVLPSRTSGLFRLCRQPATLYDLEDSQSVGACFRWSDLDNQLYPQRPFSNGMRQLSAWRTRQAARAYSAGWVLHRRGLIRVVPVLLIISPNPEISRIQPQLVKRITSFAVMP
jgi:hypothetical protein